MDVAARILHETERRYGIGFVPLGIDATDMVDSGSFDVAAFLDETSLVLDGVTLQVLFEIVDPDRHEVLFGFGEWGHHMAAWANRTFPVSERSGSAGSPCPCSECASSASGEWIYYDFYDSEMTARQSRATRRGSSPSSKWCAAR